MRPNLHALASFELPGSPAAALLKGAAAGPASRPPSDKELRAARGAQLVASVSLLHTLAAAARNNILQTLLTLPAPSKHNRAQARHRTSGRRGQTPRALRYRPLRTTKDTETRLARPRSLPLKLQNNHAVPGGRLHRAKIRRPRASPQEPLGDEGAQHVPRGEESHRTKGATEGQGPGQPRGGGEGKVGTSGGKMGTGSAAAEWSSRPRC